MEEALSHGQPEIHKKLESPYFYDSWFGEMFSQLGVGAWFHGMNGLREC